MKMERYFMTAITALVITAAIPVVDAQMDSIQLNASAYADWEDNDEARRTARRTARRVSNRNETHNSQSGSSSQPYTQPVTVLPSGCYTQLVSGIAYQNCGGVLYQPIPGQATYVIVQPPITLSVLPAGCISKQVGSSMFFECGAQVYKSVVMNGQPVYQLQ